MPSHPTRTSGRTRRRHTEAVVGLAAAVALLGATPALSASRAVDTAPAATMATTPVAVPSNVAPLKTNTSLLGVHTWYRQVQDGYPVVGGLYAQHARTASGAVTVWDGRVSVGALARTTATVTSDAAVDAAVAYTGGEAYTFITPSLWVLPGAATRLVWQVTTVTSTEGVGASNVSYVDAQTGQVVDSFVDSHSETAPDKAYTTGRARTFDANPVVKLQDEDLTDQNDSNDAVPREGYSNRKLKHLDRSHTLVGKWAKVVNDDLAASPNDKYRFFRADDDFEQVMAYYSLDTMQTFYQRLGFTDVNAEAQRIETNTIPDDNSFYSPSQDLIVMGAGGVDDAEDPEVVWHEDGHAVQDDQVPGYGQSEEAGAMGEGFGDYMAVTMSQRWSKVTDLTPTTCVMDWDATSYTPGPKHCLRTTDTPKVYPDDLEGQVHADGEIWSHALWDMNVALGRRHATTAIIEAQFSFNPAINMPDAAAIIVDTTRDLYGAEEAADARTAFEDRGIL